MVDDPGRGGVFIPRSPSQRQAAWFLFQSERMMVLQLLGPAARRCFCCWQLLPLLRRDDVALLLALFAAFACVAFALGMAEPAAEADPAKDQP